MDTELLASLRPAVRAALEAQHAIFHATTMRSPEWLQLDLSIGQLKTLVALTVRGGMTVSEIAEALRVGKPAASMLVDRLAREGYVARSEDQHDRRRTIVAPSAAGASLVERLRQGGGQSLMARWLERMSDDDLAALTHGLQALAAIAARDSAERGAQDSQDTQATQTEAPAGADTLGDTLQLAR